jgi:hypothetical protein
MLFIKIELKFYAMKRFTILLTLLIGALSINAQQYYTKNGKISFFSKALLENITADNNQVLCVLDFKTGNIQFSLLNNAFHFPKAKMEEDFNDDYIESSKYPKSTFKGTISDISKVSIDKDGTYNVEVTGDLTIHGISKKVTAPGTITIKNGKLSASSVFRITVSDYNIKIPAVVANKVSDNIEITVSCNYEKR